MDKKKILVWLSGWVDSAVTAYLLQQQGHQVVGGFMLNYLDENDPECTTKADLESFYKVCEFLKIPYEILDFRQEYSTKILNYIYEGYLRWITPNPDVLCNTEVKFKLFLDEALKLGYDGIATGHYARIVRSDELGVRGWKLSGENDVDVWNTTPNSSLLTPHLYRWIDNQKDQSYFLAGLDQFQLSKAMFPIGDMTKVQVRELAQQIDLPNANRKDSQGLCFVWDVAMGDFLREKIGEKPWDIVLQDGTIVGKHTGAYQFTVGQRKGIGLHFQCYVVDVDVVKNTVTVTTDPKDDQLYRKSVGIKSMHWISGTQPELPLVCTCKLRYRQAVQDCVVDLDGDQLKVVLVEPAKGVPNGQICVLYDGDEVLGCGEIGS